MGYHNILESDGFGIAVVGMTVVFAALMLISVFIYLLPKALSTFQLIVPAAPVPAVASPPQSTDDEEIAAAIGFALHQRNLRPNQQLAEKRV